MKTQTTISFVRHGDVHNPNEIFYGRLPRFRLSEHGCSQARSAAEFLQDKPIASIFSSPLLRARQTTEIIRYFHGHLPLRFSQLLNEVYCPFDGCPRSELASRNWDVYDGVNPPYEQPSDVLRRTQKFIARVRQQHSGQHIIAVTHGEVVGLMISWAAGMPVNAKSKQELDKLGLPDYYPATASISTFVYQTMDKDEVPSYDYIRPY